MSCASTTPRTLAHRTGRILVFSAAHPGQEGVGHISPRTQDDWQATFVEAGLRFMPNLTHLIRRLSNLRNINHRANLLVRRVVGPVRSKKARREDVVALSDTGVLATHRSCCIFVYWAKLALMFRRVGLLSSGCGCG